MKRMELQRKGTTNLFSRAQFLANAEFPLIRVFLIIGVGHPWLPRPSAGLLDPTYRCTCTCYHQRGPQALESTQGGEEPDRFRAPRGVLQVLKILKKITKQTATRVKLKQCTPVPPCSSQKQQSMAPVVFSGYVQPAVCCCSEFGPLATCCCSGHQPPAELTGSTLFTSSTWPLPLTHAHCVWCWWEPVGGLDTLHGFEKPLQREGCPH